MEIWDPKKKLLLKVEKWAEILTACMPEKSPQI